MNIGFYGHSNCAYRSPDSFLDLVANNFNANIVNQGCMQGSEERILFELKKTKDLDVAVIFHSPSKYLFIPKSDRDISVNSFDRSRADYLMERYQVEDPHVENFNPKFKELFKNNENLLEVISIYRDYFYHPDLVLNRFYGALAQIDQYLSSKKIFSIHVIDKNNNIPNWFTFNSGIVDHSTMEIIEQYPGKNPFFVNCVNRLGNILVAKNLINIIKQNYHG
jgi:hypothetical protein